jgi:hypothetical protein
MEEGMALSRLIGLLSGWLVIAVAAFPACASPVTYLSDNFESYTVGPLYGQPSGAPVWFEDNGPIRAETTFVYSGTKAAEVNYLLWGLNNGTLEEVYRNLSSGGGYHTIDMDVAMDVAPTSGGNLGYIKFFDPTGLEVTRIYQTGSALKVLINSTQVTILTNIPSREWHHVRLQINLVTRVEEVYVDGVFKASGTTYNPAASIGQIAIGQWNQPGAFTKTETYVDNLVCTYDTSVPTGTATFLLPIINGFDKRGFSHPWVIADSSAGGYRMYYTGGSGVTGSARSWGSTRIGAVTSADGANWIRNTVPTYKPVLSPHVFREGEVVDPEMTAAIFDAFWAMGPCVVKDGSTYKMWYTGWPGETAYAGGLDTSINFRIGYATSTNGTDWTRYSGSAGSESVLGLGSAGSADAKGAGMPCVIKQGSVYRMWYEGFDGSIWRILYATSTDGINWMKQGIALNPGGAGTLDQLGGREPTVIIRNGVYELWYQGQSSSAPNYHILRATSPDGLTWTKVSGEVALHPVVPPVDTGIWDPAAPEAKIAVGSILVDGSSCRVFFAKQCVRTTVLTYGSVKDRWYYMYSEVVNP